MNRNRRRVAIGVFATRAEAQATVARLQALGIDHSECLPLPPGQAPSALAEPRPASPGDSPGLVMVRAYLGSMADEQTVVVALLDSAAQSVQLHDVEQDPSDASRP